MIKDRSEYSKEEYSKILKIKRYMQEACVKQEHCPKYTNCDECRAIVIYEYLNSQSSLVSKEKTAIKALYDSYDLFSEEL